MDRKRRLMENNNGWPLRSQLFDGAPFRLPLLSTAVPASAATGTTATFTRATTKTWQNNDGYLVTGLAGEIGFPGARRVRNLLPSTEGAFSGSGWTQAGSIAVTSGVSDPLGGVTAYTLTQNGATSAELYTTTAPTCPTPIGSVWIRRRTGTGGVLLYAGAFYKDIATSLTSSWQQLKTLATDTGTSNVGFEIRLFTNGDAVDFWHPMLEDRTSTTDKTTPSEYVSVGVESAPYYHGSCVDGVKCFATDINGAPIPSTTLLGYSAEGARTNYALWNRNLTNVAWTKTSCTAALTATGADNAANSASTLTATAGNATCLQSITRVSAQRVTGCKIKRRTGTGTINMTQDNGVTWTPVTVTSAYTNVAIPAATAANPIIGFQIVTNGDAIDVDFVMHEEAAFVSSSIATTTIAVARNADVLTYSGGDIPNLKTLCATFKRESGVESAGWAVALSDGTISNYESISAASATQARFLGVTGGVTQWDVTPSYTAGTTSKAAFSAATNDIKMAKDGVAQTQDTSATVPTVTQLNVGHIAGILHFSGNVGGIYGWTRNLSQSELNAITAL